MKVDCSQCGTSLEGLKKKWNSGGPTCLSYRNAMGMPTWKESKERMTWLKFLEGCFHPEGTIHVFGEQDET